MCGAGIENLGLGAGSWGLDIGKTIKNT